MIVLLPAISMLQRAIKVTMHEIGEVAVKASRCVHKVFLGRSQ